MVRIPYPSLPLFPPESVVMKRLLAWLMSGVVMAGLLIGLLLPGPAYAEGQLRNLADDKIAERGDSLDISWLKDDSATEAQDLQEPAELAQEAINELDAAMEELRGILEELGMEVEE